MSAALRLLADVDGEPASDIGAGDIVRTGRNLFPHFRVIAVADDRAWVRDVHYQTDHIVPIDRCCKITGEERLRSQRLQ